ncbi:MerR family transcriptional regulator [Streptomyces sp. NPDC001985]|uniref:MerR family transcriptional regulator n=1 Tax=Streptomyces sp. NPDC001985 TaxID=3154406 RepID=UPI00332D1323
MRASSPPPRADIPKAGLTTGAVARRFGVAPTTLRSWDRRYGIGPASREDGRHRRWTGEDIALLERMCRLTSAGVPPSEAARAALAPGPGAEGARGPAPRPGPARMPEPRRPAASGRACQGLIHAASRLDSHAMDRLLASVVAELGLVGAWDEVIMPALHAVGRQWENSGDKGERYVEVEHLLSWHVSLALRRPAAPPAERSPVPPVLLACVPGELHTLPLEALAAALSERSVPVAMFGAAVPAEALDKAVRRTGPVAVVLWSQSLSTASRPLAQRIGSLEWGVRGARTGPAVLVAGPGWAGPHLPGTLRPRRFRDALETLLSLCAPQAGP